jgi:4-amino-4-deoxy-L-arabinose transferase-like glycosyltransferase
VTQTDTSTLENQSAFPAARVAWILLILATLYICYFYSLGAIGFVGPDEPRYAWIARGMAESGDWVTPRLYGKPWFEKPILYYWGAAASFKLFGVSEAAARFPSALAALFATLAMAWLAWRVYGAETARWLLLLLPTTVGMIGFSHAAATDMPFAGMLTVAMVCAAAVVGLVRDGHTSIIPRTPWLALLLFGFFLGLAVLAKGPVAIILSGGAILLWAAFTKRWRDAFRCLHPIASASFCLAALPWYILCARRNPDFFRVFIVEHNFKRYLTPEFQHIQPFWFYIPILLIAFLPWTLALLWSSLYSAVRYLPTRRLSPIAILLLCWPIFCLVFFSISKSKLPGYILPALPAIGLLLARSYVHLVPRKEKPFRWLHLTIGLTVGILSGVWLFSSGPAFQPSKTNRQLLTSVAWTLLLLALTNLLLALRSKPPRYSKSLNWFCVVPVLALVCLFPQVSSPWLRYDPSGKTIACELTEKQIPVDKLYVAQMARGQQYSLNFYLHREVETWNKENPSEGFLLLPSGWCGGLVTSPWACVGKPVELRASGWLVYRVERSGSVTGLGGFGALGRDDNLRHSADRQPR